MMPADLPQLIGTPRLIAIAEKVRERVLATIEDTSRRDAFRFLRSSSADWDQMAAAEQANQKAFAAILSQVQAHWWVARRAKPLVEMAAEVLEELGRYPQFPN